VPGNGFDVYIMSSTPELAGITFPYKYNGANSYPADQRMAGLGLLKAGYDYNIAVTTVVKDNDLIVKQSGFSDCGGSEPLSWWRETAR